MYLTVSKRFEFSTSTRLWRDDLSAAENVAYFGPNRSGRYGTGYNFIAHLVFHGPVDTRTGMLINVSIIKERVLDLLEKRFDHKFLNADTPPFDKIPPTPENIAIRLLREAQPLFAGESAKPVACHLEVPPDSGATAYAGGRVEEHHLIRFSAARRTASPFLTDEENRALFGIAASPHGHGHNYTLRASCEAPLTPEHGLVVSRTVSTAAMEDLRRLLDHKHLNEEVVELKGIPVTTECLARFAFQRLSRSMPVHRVRLHETEYFFAEYGREGRTAIGLQGSFNASHRLHSPVLNDQQNLSVYGKCNNPAGHGHWYQVEATVAGILDERTGALEDLSRLQRVLGDSLRPWDGKHLDHETEDFMNRPSTSENIVTTLWPRLSTPLGDRLSRLRLWETANNRFTLRHDPVSST